jgi:hypothetical protein
VPGELDLTFLYYFSAPSQDLLEVRINGLPEGTPPGRVYHWLHEDRAAQQLQKLTFQSMGSDHTGDFRVFSEAELHFDATQAQLCWTSAEDKETHVLDVLPVDSISSELAARVQRFLRGLLS